MNRDLFDILPAADLRSTRVLLARRGASLVPKTDLIERAPERSGQRQR